MVAYRTDGRAPADAAALESLSRLLEGPPGPATWNALVSFFRRRGDAWTAEEVAQVEVRLSRWPDELRSLLVEADAADEALTKPMAPLARSFEISEGDGAAAVEALIRRWPNEARHVRLACTCNNVGAAVRRLDALPHLVGVDVDVDAAAEGVEALSAVELPLLRSLHLGAPELTARLAEIPAWPRLRRLSLWAAEVEAGEVAALFEPSRSPLRSRACGSST